MGPATSKSRSLPFVAHTSIWLSTLFGLTARMTTPSNGHFVRKIYTALNPPNAIWTQNKHSLVNTSIRNIRI
ncbi:uncharacterized protein LY79DRAFT_553557 [Colletotrichum navitas]|uniref:Secreted protein n=1 Tax=Colletotrichum navitas TaxID=681940 RepID=A0AAD8V559_9PEZI|nr:uncharacterized protein LY79DRAFT_553557 [Colletotrichum navitas]KAK1590911.1 hypothetical protein LY79DRAFT_553557 [Colletotrichum navitas]